MYEGVCCLWLDHQGKGTQLAADDTNTVMSDLRRCFVLYGVVRATKHEYRYQLDKVIRS